MASDDVLGFVDEIRGAVDRELAAFFERKLACTQEISEDGKILVESVRDLTLRGGKRLRAALVVAGHRAVRWDAPIAPIVAASMSFELLQSYLLIQDDWMDQDDTRRGGPSVHTALRDHFADPHIAASLAILAGDLGCAYAHEVLVDATFDDTAVRRALSVLTASHEEVVLGQFLDVAGLGPVETVHLLKTSGYTVRAPLRLGAVLAGASDEALAGLDGFAKPIGVAFQLRDDVLGTFGDPKATGKAAANDLRAGKRTALVAEARKRLADADRAPLEEVLGASDATEAAVAEVRALIERCGALAAVEARIAELTAEALGALESAPVDDRAKALLRGVGDKLVNRKV